MAVPVDCSSVEAEYLIGVVLLFQEVEEGLSDEDSSSEDE